MPTALRNTFAVIAGLVIGSIVNMGIITLGPMVIAPPPGVDMTTSEGLVAGVALFQPQHFGAPFLAHALGTLVGAFVAMKVSASHGTTLAYGIGGFFLLGGIWMVVSLPTPTWFIALDLIGAYVPMAWLAIRVGGPRDVR